MAELTKGQQNDALPTRPQQNRSGFWLGLVAILLAIGIGGLAFYLNLQQQGQQKDLSGHVDAQLKQKDQQVMELTQQISGYQTQLAAIQSQLANVQQDSSGKDSHFNQVLDDFAKLHSEKLDVTRNELQSSIEQVQRILGKTRSDWLLADAEYLLSVANERLQLMGDVHTAKQALESADARLRESEDAAVFKVREQLTKELAELAKITPLDVVGVYSKISALQQSVKSLTIFLPYVGKDTKPANPEETSTSQEHASGWLDNTLHGIQKYVSVRHSSKPIAGIISQEEAEFGYQQLGVRLEMVKIALLQQNDQMYQTALSEALQWLKDNFTLNAAANDFVAQLSNLQALKLKSQFPNIGESAKMLKDISKLRLETDKTLGKKTTSAAATKDTAKTEVAAPKINTPSPVKAADTAAPAPAPAPTPVPTSASTSAPVAAEAVVNPEPAIQPVAPAAPNHP